jgi:hypothetical protein
MVAGYRCCVISYLSRFEGSKIPRRINNYFWTARQFVCPIFKGQAIQEERKEFFWDCLTVEDGKDRFYRNGGNQLLSYVTERPTKAKASIALQRNPETCQRRLNSLELKKNYLVFIAVTKEREVKVKKSHYRPRHALRVPGR